MAQSLWSANGTTLHSPELSKQMREQAAPFYIFRQFTDVKNAFGAHKGDSFQYTKRLLVDTRGGTLTETVTMPVNEIKFVKDSVTVTEFGNGVNYTQKIDTLSEFNMRDQFQMGLVEDQRDTIDREVGSKYISAEFKGVCSASSTLTITTNGTATASATANPTDDNIRSAVTFLKRKHVPLIGNHYISILSPVAHAGLYDTLQSIAQYADPQFRFNSETGRYYGVRFVEENNMLSNTVNSSYGEGVIFGAESVCEAVALPEELRFEETDMGRSKKLAWYAILGFKKIWSQSNDDSNSTGKGFERILHFTSVIT